MEKKILWGVGTVNWGVNPPVIPTLLQGKEHRSLTSGFSADELVAALNKLAANDANKRRIVEFGFLPLYVELLQPGFCSVTELTEATQGLWILAFKCRDDIIGEPGCLVGRHTCTPV